MVKISSLRSSLWISLWGILVGFSIGCHQPLHQSTPHSETAYAGERIAEEEVISLERLNSTRSKHGLSPVQRLTALDKVARDHSRNMRNREFFDHRDPSGRDLSDRLREAHIPFRWAAENLSWIGQTDHPAEESLGYFLESPTHRTHLLNPSYPWVGIGFAQQGRSFWITHIYVRKESKD